MTTFLLVCVAVLLLVVVALILSLVEAGNRNRECFRLLEAQRQLLRESQDRELDLLRRLEPFRGVAR